jgi:hypothetical protein
MNKVERTIGRLETELKTNEEYKAKVIREIETRGQEVIDTIEGKQFLVTFAFRCFLFRVHFLCILKDMIFTYFQL